jgi:GLPGLI family protein
MKNSKAVILCVAVFSVFILQAQTFQGKAFYQTKRNFEIEMDSTQVNNEMQKELQAMLKKQFEKTYILTFNKEESIYKEEVALDKPQAGQSGIMIIVGGASDVLYKNVKAKNYTKAEEIYGKKFLIQDSLKTIAWTITKETKMIGKYLCIKATSSKMIDDFDGNFEKKQKQKEIQITAWYTPEIPVGNGPDFFEGLPGLIMELHEDKMHYVCIKIILNPKDKDLITKPTKGTKTTQTEFDTIKKKKAKEMMEQFQGGKQKKGKGFTMTIRG